MEFGKYIAHRGLYGQSVPENSLKAFSLAKEKGFACELDVRLTKDGRVVVIHDNNLNRMCGIDANISEFTYEQLSAFTLNGSNEKIPLLTEVLKEMDGEVPLLIEIKGDAPFWTLEKRAYHILKKYKGRYAVESFNPLSMLWFRIFAPTVERGQLVSDYRGKKHSFYSEIEYLGRKICMQPIVWKLVSKPQFVAADMRSVTMEMLFSALDMGADLIGWTAASDELIDGSKAFTKSVIFENYENLSHDFSDNYEESDK